MASADFDETFYLATNPDVALAIRAGHIQSAWEHFCAYGKKEGRRGRNDATDVARTEHRAAAVYLLRGSGIEIGAFDSPCPLPAGCRVTYCDRLRTAEAKKLFPEMEHMLLQEPDVLVDIDRTGLVQFQDGSQDFVIFSHVIEHVANPIAALRELFRVTRRGGRVVIGAPDSRFNFDRDRGLTSFEHLLEEYRAGVTELSLTHYMDIIALNRPEVVRGGVDAIEATARELRHRAEHAHVWNSATFRAFLDRAFELLDLSVDTLFEATGDQTRHEYFAVFEKRS